MSLGVAGLEIYGRLISRNGVGKPPQTSESISEIIVGLGISGPKLQGLPKSRERIIQRVGFVQCDPKVVPCLGMS